MTRLTPGLQGPYPLPAERGNAPVDLDLLAHWAERQTVELDEQYGAEIEHPAAVYGIGSNQTGVLNDYWQILMDTTVSAVGLTTGSSRVQIDSAEMAGWYVLSASVSCQPSGGTIGTRRVLRLTINKRVGAVEQGTEDFFVEEIDIGGVTVVAMEIVCYLGLNYAVVPAIFHNNSSSSLTITTAHTRISAYRIMGDV